MVHVDVGTGDGELPYRLAQSQPGALFVGIDASVDALRVMARRAARKASKGGVDNLVLMHGSAEAVPAELATIADVVSVYFPWAALLRAVLGTNPPALEGIARLAKKGAHVEIVLSADRARDGALDGIPILDAPFVRGELAEAYARAGLTLRHATTLGRPEVQAIPTSWAKRLGHGAPRTVWRLVAIK